MNKAELIAKIEAKFGTIYKTLLNETTGDAKQFKWYKAVVLEETAEGVNAVGIPYFVAGEGTPTEAAEVMQGWKQRLEPRPSDEKVAEDRFKALVAERLLALRVEAEAQKQFAAG